MPSLYYLTMALAATTSVIASPVQIEKRGFSINQVAHGTFRKNGPEQIIRTLRKFNKPVPAYLLAAVENSQTVSIESSGSAPANPSDSNDSSYLTPVTVGSKTLNLDFDTGSSDLWVYSSLQAASQRSGHNYYQADSSKLKQGYTWKISYGDGSGASGKVYADKVVVGGVTATSQAVEAATSVSSSFSQDRNTDGLLGLAMSSLNTVKPQQQKTFFDTVIPQLDKPLFAVTLKYHAAGSYDFGYIDSSKYTGNINYVNADTSQGWWGISTSGYTIAGKKYSGSSSGILDTGTTLMYVDASIASNYYSQVDGAQNDSSQGGYTFPCDAQLPDFGIIVGGVNQVVPGKYFNYAPVDSSGQTCFGGMQPNDSIGFSIFGDIFLKSKYIVHEMGSTPRIGFAQQAGV